MDKLRAAIYKRVSTGEQDSAMQETELRAYAARKQWNVTAVYSDVISGAKDRRPGLGQLMQDARGHKFDVVLVYRLDRLGRSVQHLILTVNELRNRGVLFVSLSEGLDFSSPAGEFMFHVIAAVAQFERAIIKQRVTSAIAQARLDGKVLGRPRKVIDAGKVDDLRSAGRSWAEIAEEIGAKPGAIRLAHARYVAALHKSPTPVVQSDVDSVESVAAA